MATLDPIAVYFLLEPDWDAGISVYHVWRTGILRSMVGGEQRSEYYSWARLKIRFSLASMNYTEWAWLQRSLNRYLHDIWGIPIWPDAATLSSDVDAGASVLPVDATAYRHFVEGDKCIIIKSDDFTVYEAFDILTLAADQITIDGTLVNDFGLGTRVFPVFRATIGMTLNITNFLSRVGQIELEAIESYHGTP